MTAESAVAELYEQLIAAWNERDAERFGAPFADHGVVIGFDGSELNGREAIARELGRIFADHPTAEYVAKVREVAPLAEDVVLLRAVVGMTPPDGGDLMPERNAHQTVVAKRTADDWQIVLFQNTPAQFDGRPELVEQLTQELRRLV